MRWTAGLIAMLITAGCSSPSGIALALNDASGSELTRDDNDIAGDEAALETP